jgi:hypothetical protein
VSSPGWSGTGATVAWDGTGAPGNGDPFVDILNGPALSAFAVAAATKDKLDPYVDAMRKVNTMAHMCPIKPGTTTKIKVGGSTARLDTDHCGDVFAMSATVVRGGRAYVFATFGAPSSEADIRAGFDVLLKGVSFPS